MALVWFNVTAFPQDTKPDGPTIKRNRTIVKEVVYQHNKHIAAKELADITRVRWGMPLDKTVNRMACIYITEYLVKQGYLLANVSLLEGDNDEDERVVFNITEGPRVRVRNISFMGAKFAFPSRLREIIDCSKGDLYRPETVQNDLTTITEYHRHHGFLAAQVSREVRFSDDYRNVDIVFHIGQGLRYRVADWSVEGARVFPNATLAKFVQLRKGSYFNQEVINKVNSGLPTTAAGAAIKPK